MLLPRVSLSAQEKRVNNLLMSAKRQTYDNCFDQMCFPPARHFFDAKSDIENSEVFRIIKRMPKGEMKINKCYLRGLRNVSRDISIKWGSSLDCLRGA